MAWDEAFSLTDRFAGAMVLMSRRLVGRTYQGFIKASCRLSPELLQHIGIFWRHTMPTWLASHWLTDGWVVLGVDGSKYDLPRTTANEEAFGVSGKRHGGPQACLCMVLHLASSLPFCWEIGQAMTSERHMLRNMLPFFPARCLLVADAGFTGYDLWRTLNDAGHAFLIRAGANVRLLKSLGCKVKQRADLVYVWPMDAQQQKAPPLVLRAIYVRDGDRLMCLLTNVLDEARLTQAQAVRFYGMRWGIELWFRGMKQTLRRRQLRSAAPVQAKLELRWAVLAMALLGLMGVKACIDRGGNPNTMSFVGVVRAIRTLMRQPDQRCGRQRLTRLLAKAVKDTYTRKRPKRARGWPHKKSDPRPGLPQITEATELQRQLAKELPMQQLAA